ncbi:MAG: prolyl oligopeptidase family serine peptidase [Myxococcales bacterium]|nr:prolyl oligopeptidase family serine peptidase [Myxococcales bacterium]
MKKVLGGWYSHRLDESVNVARYGTGGQPILLFPTAGGDAEECERFLMMKVLAPLIDGGKIKIYSCDSIAGRAWIDGDLKGRTKAAIQNRFDAFIYRELVPAIRADSRNPNAEIITAGASIGAFNAVASLCRHPDVFKACIAMSGTYDFGRWMTGDHTLDYHYSSPLHFLPSFPEGPELDQLRRRFALIATGEGRWEAPEESWRIGQVLGSRGVPNRVDFWGKDKDHDWMTWREMLPHYLGKLASEGKL